MLCSQINMTKKPCHANKEGSFGTMHPFFVEGIPHPRKDLVDFGFNSGFYCTW